MGTGPGFPRAKKFLSRVSGPLRRPDDWGDPVNGTGKRTSADGIVSRRWGMEHERRRDRHSRTRAQANPIVPPMNLVTVRVISMLRAIWRALRRGRRAPAERRLPSRFVPGFESLETRLTPAVTAFFSPGS